MGVDVFISNAGVFAGGEEDALKGVCGGGGGACGGSASRSMAPRAGNPDDFDRMVKVNALAPMRLIRALAPKMCDKARAGVGGRQGGGRACMCV